MTRQPPSRALVLAALLLTSGLGAWRDVPGVSAEGEATVGTPPAELAGTLRGLGPPGLLWGRLAVEEESPDGPATPLAGVEVQLYLAVPGLLADLDRIRQGARDSVHRYETAVARIQAALVAHQAAVDAAGRTLTPALDPLPGRARRVVTDPAGLFVFEDLPAGPWLLVATRVAPYGKATGRPETRRRAPSREPRFLPRAEGSSREAEIWLVPIQASPGRGGPLLLTDRARWLVGPAPPSR